MSPLNDSRAADAMTASANTETTGLYTPPLSAMSARVNAQSKPVTSHEYRVRRTSSCG